MRRIFLVQLALFAACADDVEESPRPRDAGGLLDAAMATDAAPFDPGEGACPPPDETPVEVTSAYHVMGQIPYADPPPAGGNHNPSWATWAVYHQELPDECWVHNLEHGGIVFLYRCPDGCPQEVAALAEFVEPRAQTLLTPYAALPTRFGVVAWGFRLLTDCFDLTRFARFYAEHVNEGPEKLSRQPDTPCR